MTAQTPVSRSYGRRAWQRESDSAIEGGGAKMSRNLDRPVSLRLSLAFRIGRLFDVPLDEIFTPDPE